MVTYEDIIRVRIYTDIYVPEPKPGLTREVFKEACYSNWAMNEIINRMLDNLTVDPILQMEEDRSTYSLTPIDIIQEFIGDMQYYIENTEDSCAHNLIFSIAKEEACCLLLYFERNIH